MDNKVIGFRTGAPCGMEQCFCETVDSEGMTKAPLRDPVLPDWCGIQRQFAKAMLSLDLLYWESFETDLGDQVLILLDKRDHRALVSLSTDVHAEDGGHIVLMDGEGTVLIRTPDFNEVLRTFTTMFSTVFEQSGLRVSGLN